jgi:uncharacterized membrane protein
MAQSNANRRVAKAQPTVHPLLDPLERLAFFSDAVFAIAITLLVIDLKTPVLAPGSPDSAHAAALAGLIPHFAGFLVSFAVIGTFWAAHHRTFGLSARYSPRLLLPNFALLAAIAFMPFATAYGAANFGQRVPAVVYDSVLILSGLFMIRLAHIATAPPVVETAAEQRMIGHVRARTWGVTIGAALALLLSLVTPMFGQFALLTIPFLRRAAIRWGERQAG